MKKIQYIILVIVALLASGCASTNYKAWEGKNTVFEGQGGTRNTINGIDFWENGDPPRKFQFMGIIEDDRPGGIIPMARLKGDVAREAKAQGADAVIIFSSGSQITGYITSFGTSTASSVPLRRNNARFAVIKYLD